MKEIQYPRSLFLVLILLMSFLVACTDNEPLQGNGIIEQDWKNDQVYVITTGGKKTVNFTTKSGWVARSSSPALTLLDRNSGGAGKNTLTITVNHSSDKEAVITIHVNGYADKSNFKVRAKKQNELDNEINYDVNDYLKDMYLWNEEYKKLNPDFTLSYNDFVVNTLKSMKENTLDYKPYQKEDGTIDYLLYSYIRKLDPDLQSHTRTKSNTIEKEKEYNYGFIGLLPAQKAQSTKVFFVIKGVHPGSSAEKAGLRRGMEIHEVGKKAISITNWSEIYDDLMHPDTPNTLTIEASTSTDKKTYTVNSGPIEVNPVIFNHVKQIGSHRIGYLVYNKFDAGFDQELFDVFKKFKKESITDLILDLRYNGGGHVMSAQLISSCIAGKAHEGKVFASFRYNDERMKVLNNQRERILFLYAMYENLKSSIAESAVNLTKVYCLVSHDTASASELVINSLKGIGIDVVLVGKQTNGKNVGMEGTNFTTQSGTYEFFPITFQSYNANGYGDYQNGFTPNFDLNENNPQGEGFEGYKEFGADNEPLYAKAVSLITGKRFLISSTRTTRVETAKILPVPETRQIGMIR